MGRGTGRDEGTTRMQHTSTSRHDTSRHVATCWPRCRSRQVHEHARSTSMHATEIPIGVGVREGRGHCRWSAMEVASCVPGHVDTQIALASSPTSPAPPPRSIAHMFRHGKVRPRHPLPHQDHAHRPVLVHSRLVAKSQTAHARSAGPRQRSARAWSPHAWKERPKV